MKKIFFAFCIISSTIWSVKSQVVETTLATFEPRDNTSGYSIEDGGFQSLNIIDNTDNGGLNKTYKTLYGKTKNATGNWYVGVNVTFPQFTANENDKRYLHVAIKTDLPAYEFMIVAGGNQKWVGKSVSHPIGVWFDYVIDLKNGVKDGNLIGTTISSLRVAVSVNESPQRNKDFYIDEIVVSNDATPRISITALEPPLLGLIADFEESGLTPTISQEESPFTTLQVVAHPQDETGLNGTVKSLYGKTKNASATWWGGARLNFSPFTVNAEFRYLHILIKSNLAKMEFDINPQSDDKWTGSFNPSITNGGNWFDKVIDLNSYVSGKQVSVIRICTHMDQSANRDKEFYIDEIIVNNNPNPRTVVTTSLWHNEKKDFETGAVYSTANGIEIKGISGNVYVYNLIGNLIYQGISAGDISIALNAGYYIISADNIKQKVFIKRTLN